MKMRVNADPALPLADAANYLGFSKKHVYNLCKVFRKLAYVQSGKYGSIRIRLSELNRFLGANEHRAGREAV